MEAVKGLIIAEGLDDPTIIKQFAVHRAAISAPTRPIDTAGTLGRRHYYWISCAPQDAAAVAETLRALRLPGWYAHLWDAQPSVPAS